MGDIGLAIAVLQARFNRTLLVVGTLGVAVLGERVAREPRALGYWLLLLAAVLCIPLSDVGRELEEAARTLADTANADSDRARRDVVSARAPAWFRWAPMACVVLAVGGGLTLGLWQVGQHADDRASGAPCIVASPSTQSQAQSHQSALCIEAFLPRVAT